MPYPWTEPARGKAVSSIQDPGAPRYWISGSVTTSKDFKKQMTNVLHYANEHYEARSTVAFLPSELRIIRQFLLSANSLPHLMLWCIIVIGVRLFLRIDEVLELTVEQFVTEYFVVTGRDIKGLLVKIQGKRDKKPVHLSLWDDLDCPEFSPLRPLFN